METYLTFILQNEYFAVSVSNVLEVLQKQYITYVPRAPEDILGIINFRGEILPVIDTRNKFNLKTKTLDDKQIVIVFEEGNEETKTTLAAVADSVEDVIEVKNNEIKQLPELGLNYNNQYISGAIRRNETFIMVLNIKQFIKN